jgi:NAD(P)H dehydrogenase (quinone)
MSKILMITAHPTKENLTRGITDLYEAQKKKQGHTVRVIDLYEEVQLPYYTFESFGESSVSEDAKRYQEMVTDADEIVFVYPFWWGTMPAILKNWIDTVFTMGFAAKYGKNGRPIGLLQGKSVRIFCTSGAPTFIYCINGIRGANKKIWRKTIVEFCGMKFDGYHLFGGMDTRAKKVDKMFKCVKKIANK